MNRRGALAALAAGTAGVAIGRSGNSAGVGAEQSVGLTPVEFTAPIDMSDTYLTRVDTVLAETSKTIRVISTSKTDAVFAEVVDSISSNGVVDPVLEYGYNIGQSGSRRSDSEPSWCITFEGGWFNPSSGHEQVEWHLQYNGILGVKRPISVAVDKVTGHTSTALQVTSGPVNSIGTTFAVIDQDGAGVLSYDGACWYVKDSMVIEGGPDGVLDLGDAVVNSGVQFNLRAAPGGTCYQTWNEGTTQRWIDYVPAGDASPRYIRDAVNEKMHVTYQPGPGAGGGSSVFDCKVDAYSLEVQSTSRFLGEMEVQGGTYGVLTLGDATTNQGVQFNLRAAPGATCYQTWNEGATERWIDYVPAGAASPRYMRDSLNAKMHVTYEPGAGTGGGASIFDCRVSAHSLEVQSASRFSGDVGFYGAAPAAKPVVSGSRSNGAALRSVLTALSALGLVTNSTVA